MRVASFDVFDTLVTRVQARPTDLFLELGADLRSRRLIAIADAEFARLRVQAEECARLPVPRGEATFEEIYDRLAEFFKWSGEARAQAQELELGLEAGSLRPVPEMLARVAKARGEADCVLFLSDMYLPGAFLQTVLNRAGFWQPGDRLFVSNEHRRAKCSGELFDHVRAALPGISRWTHVGDNPHSDVAVPRSRGIVASEFVPARLNRLENSLRGPNPAPSPLRCRLAGIARLARLDLHAVAERERTIGETAVDVVAPLLFGYVHWCLSEAVRRNLRRLYFQSRDGQILFRIAQVLAPRWGFEVECRYLKVSRQALHPAAIERFGAAQLDYVRAAGPGLSVRQLLWVVCLEPELVATTLNRHGFPPESWETPLLPPRRAALEQLLVTDSVARLVEPAANRRRDLLLSYLTQEGVLDGAPVAMVDIGWRGNLQRSMTRALNLAGHPGPMPVGLYFGLLPAAPGDTPQPMTGYWNQFISEGTQLAYGQIGLLERFTAADHGNVTGYARCGEGVEATLAPEENQPALQWGLRAMQTAILRATERLATELSPAVFDEREFFTAAWSSFAEFYTSPTRAEAELWGNCPLSTGQIETKAEVLVPEWTWGRALRTLWRREERLHIWWHAGALATGQCLPVWLYLKLLRHPLAALRRIREHWR